MTRWILSQGGHILYPTTKPIFKGYCAIRAEHNGEILGRYSTELEVEQVWLDLQEWLVHGNNEIYKLPQSKEW